MKIRSTCIDATDSKDKQVGAIGFAANILCCSSCCIASLTGVWLLQLPSTKRRRASKENVEPANSNDVKGALSGMHREEGHMHGIML